MTAVKIVAPGKVVARGLLWLLLMLALACGGPQPAAQKAPPGDAKRGEYLATIFACKECHTLRKADGLHLDPPLFMAGGIPFDGPWGVVHSANVTAVAGKLPPSVLEDMIRGRLSYKFQMPTDLYNEMAADDMRDIIAWLRTLQPVARPAPDNRFKAGYRPPAPNPAIAIPQQAPRPGAPGRGEYLAKVAICKDCHSPRGPGGEGYDEARLFAGAGIALRFGDGRVLLPPNLTPDPESGLGRWTDAQIAAAVRAGVRPDGRRLNPMMPYIVAFEKMTDEDIGDIIRYLRSLKPVKTNRPPNPVYTSGDAPPDCCFAPPPEAEAAAKGVRP